MGDAPVGRFDRLDAGWEGGGLSQKSGWGVTANDDRPVEAKTPRHVVFVLHGMGESLVSCLQSPHSTYPRWRKDCADGRRRKWVEGTRNGAGMSVSRVYSKERYYEVAGALVNYITSPQVRNSNFGRG